MDGGTDRLAARPGLIVGAVLLFLALFEWPYGYYILLRWVVAAASAYAAWVAYENRRNVWTWVLGVIALLFNPIFPFHMRREDWAIFDILSGMVLLAAAVSFSSSRAKRA